MFFQEIIHPLHARKICQAEVTTGLHESSAKDHACIARIDQEIYGVEYMGADLSFLSYFVSSSIIVQLVILVLLIASIISWTIIFQRGFSIGATQRKVKKFEQRFWDAENLENLYRDLEKRGEGNDGLAALFKAGYSEFIRLRDKPGISSSEILEGVRRVMRAAFSYEEDALESHLSFLATIGSTSPYIGLFGTVWGIMTSFHALGDAQQVTISMVAPGISEALIATAMGLFAAIPAVIFYNRYINRSDRILNRYDAFQEEFISLLQHKIERHEIN